MRVPSPAGHPRGRRRGEVPCVRHDHQARGGPRRGFVADPYQRFYAQLLRNHRRPEYRSLEVFLGQESSAVSLTSAPAGHYLLTGALLGGPPNSAVRTTLRFHNKPAPNMVVDILVF